jgi:GTP-binding protein YchF
MKLAVTGLSQSGKTRVFCALTGRDADGAAYSREPGAAVVKVPDERLDFLHSHFPDKKKVQADFELVDFGPAPGRDRARTDAIKETELFGHLRTADAFLVVLRAFASDAAAPALGKVDPLAEWEEFRASLMLADATQVERALKRLSKRRGIKAGSPEDIERKILLRLKEHLDDLQPLSEFEMTAEEKRLFSSFQFLSAKPVLVLLNVDEDALGAEHPAEAEIAGTHSALKISAQVEMELAQLDDEDRAAFMDELGVAALMRERVITEAYRALGLISFFTVGKDEVRAWRLGRGMSAVEAAGGIHTDFARGFIRAEVVGFNDFKETPSLKDLRAKGRARLEGKEYTVADGDIIEFRFNV